MIVGILLWLNLTRGSHLWSGQTIFVGLVAWQEDGMQEPGIRTKRDSFLLVWNAALFQGRMNLKRKSMVRSPPPAYWTEPTTGVTVIKKPASDYSYVTLMTRLLTFPFPPWVGATATEPGTPPKPSHATTSVRCFQTLGRRPSRMTRKVDQKTWLVFFLVE